jgi:hypothetical protein
VKGSLSGAYEECDKSEHGKGTSERGHSPPGERKGGTSQDAGRKQARGTHVLESTEGWTSQDMERK